MENTTTRKITHTPCWRCDDVESDDRRQSAEPHPEFVYRNLFAQQINCSRLPFCLCICKCVWLCVWFRVEIPPKNHDRKPLTEALFYATSSARVVAQVDVSNVNCVLNCIPLTSSRLTFLIWIRAVHTVFLAQRARGIPMRPVVMHSLHSSKKNVKYKTTWWMEQTIMHKKEIQTHEANIVEVLNST